MKLLLIMTAPPHHPLAWHAVQLAKAACDDTDTELATFFYLDAVTIANAYIWQPQDKPSIQTAWQQLAQIHHLSLPVCVSAALARGVTDTDNAKRHHITQPPQSIADKQTAITEPANNLATYFELAGLGELAEKMHWADKTARL